MPIYTKKGDKGKTRTFHGEMSKSDALAEALGSIDELNSWIGFVRSQIFNYQLPITNELSNSKFSINRLDDELKNIQTNLLNIGSGLAGSKKKIGVGEVKKLERLIDRLTKELPSLKNFIYPMGEIQVARAVCRRAERRVVNLLNNTLSDPPLNLRGGRGRLIIRYLNRLSDVLFTISRWVNYKIGIKEDVWK